MISLLDANVLIALFDAAHIHHERAQQWLTDHRARGWATCPLTQNACIRILSQPAYSGRLAIADIARRLRHATDAKDHHFWPDTLKLCDPAFFAHEQILTPKYLTDIYLLSLAVKHGSRLVTFYQNIPIHAVRSAEPRHLVIL
jgi:toxin-antitoxin system PIN domain toxin